MSHKNMLENKPYKNCRARFCATMISNRCK